MGSIGNITKSFRGIERSRVLSRLFGHGPRAATIGAVCLVALLALALNMVRHVPQMPVFEGDTPDYLTIAAHRPPLYGWLLAGYRSAFGSLRLLPLLQLSIIAFGLLVFSTELALLLDSAFAGLAAIVLVMLHVQIHDSPAWILSEPLFLGLVLAGLGLQFRHARSASLNALLLAMLCFGLAADTRTTGTIFLIMPVASVLFDRRLSWRRAMARAAMTMAVAGSLLLVSMTGNWIRHGYFAVGTATGESLLGKAIITLQPQDLAGLPAAVAPMLPVAEAGRRVIAAQPDLAARLRTEIQVGWDLKYTGFYEGAKKVWPAFSHADRQQKNWLMERISDKLISAHPGAYLSLVGHSWLGLILYPAYWPNWAGSDTTNKAGAPLCDRTQRCWLQERFDIGGLRFLTMLSVSIAATAASLLVILLRTLEVLRRRASPVLVGFWTLSLVLQGSLAVTAFTEQALPRYTVGLHVLGVALLIWLASAALRSGSRSRNAAGLMRTNTA